MCIELVGILACFCGVLLMAQSDSNAASDIIVSQVARVLGFVLMCICAANDGMVAVLARQMKDLHFSVMMYWFSTVGLVLTSATITAMSLYSRSIPSILLYDYSQYKSLVLCGVCSSINLTCLTIAYQNDKSTTVSLLAYIELVYAFAADIFLFDSRFSTKELIGAAIITFFNILTIIERGKVEEERKS